MTNDERLTALEARLATAEARIGVLENKANFPMIQLTGTSYPQPGWASPGVPCMVCQKIGCTETHIWNGIAPNGTQIG